MYNIIQFFVKNSFSLPNNLFWSPTAYISRNNKSFEGGRHETGF